MAIDLNSIIYIAGHQGMVGSAIHGELKLRGFKNIITKTRAELDLINQNDVEQFYKKNKPEFVFVCAAKVGGILANDNYRAQFIYENIQIQNNLIHFAYKYNVNKLLFLGSSCIYPRKSKQPIREEYLLTDELEKTNEPYAIAKIAGLKMCQSYYDQYSCNFISAMPTNLYGINDNFDLESSHVIPALIRKIHDAKILKKNHVKVWGSGKPLRDFLHVDDLAKACIFLIENVDAKDLSKFKICQINIGSGKEISIADLAMKIIETIEFKGKIMFDKSKPDGTMKKLLDNSRINSLGWHPSISIDDGIKKTYHWYKSNINQLAK